MARYGYWRTTPLSGTPSRTWTRTRTRTRAWVRVEWRDDAATAANAFAWVEVRGVSLERGGREESYRYTEGGMEGSSFFFL